MHSAPQSKNIEERALPKYLAAMEEYRELREIAKVALADWKTDCRKAHKEGRERPPIPKEVVRLPPKPNPQRLLTSDTSVEEVQDLLAENPRGLVYLRSELIGFISSFGRYTGNAATERAFYLESYDGRAYVVDRKKNELPTRIPYNSLAVTGGITLDRLVPVFKDENNRDGFTARFLYIYPDRTPPTPCDPGRQSCVGELDDALTRLWLLQFGEDYDRRGIPNILRPNADAIPILEAVRQETYQATQQEAESGIVLDWLNKNPGRLLRIALVLEMLVWAKGTSPHRPTEISAENMERARRYLQYCKLMVYRVLGELVATDAQRDAAAIGRHILKHQLIAINEREIYQTQGFSRLRDQAVRKAAFKELTQAGWVSPRKRTGPGRPSGDWEVNPKVLVRE
jgi:hypothetical protein